MSGFDNASANGISDYGNTISLQCMAVYLKHSGVSSSFLHVAVSCDCPASNRLCPFVKASRPDAAALLAPGWGCPEYASACAFAAVVEQDVEEAFAAPEEAAGDEGSDGLGKAVRCQPCLSVPPAAQHL